MRSIVSIAAAALAAAALAACAASPPAAAPPEAIPAPILGPSGPAMPAFADYLCENGARFRASFREASDDVVISFNDGREPLTLKRRPADAGFVYGDLGMHELRGQGLEATWTVGRMVPTKCVDVTEAK